MPVPLADARRLFGGRGSRRRRQGEPAGRGDAGSDTTFGSCADGTWAGWDSPDGVVWVSPGGSDAAAGTSDAPLATILAAMEQVRGVTDARVGLLAGTYLNPG